MKTSIVSMTEDDTFRILSRSSVNEIIILANRWEADFNDRRQFEIFLSQNGWTYRELDNLVKYENEFVRR